MAGLDEGYALLSEVRARHYELQARLRTSLPQLWRDDALVLDSSVSETRGRRGAATTSTSTATGGDGKLTSGYTRGASGKALASETALESQAQTSRRYRRRVEWEVARRIARVDRELQKYPPAQRFWHQREKKSKSEPVSLRKTGRYGRVGNIGASTKLESFERDLDPAGTKRSGAVGPRIPATSTDITKSAVKEGASTAHRRQNSTRLEPNTSEKPRGQWTEKGTSWSKITVDPISAGDKENRPPSPLFEGKAALAGHCPAITMDSPLSQALDTKPDPFKSVPKADKVAVLDGDMPTADASVPDQPYAVVTTPSSPSPKTDPVQQTRQLAVIEGFKKEEKEADDVLRASELGDEAPTQVHESPRRAAGHPEEHPLSSIGRQVLSEYRTMPSVASFGSQPMLSAGGRGHRQLNADVLRRLFSDLDVDHDGYVNRIETCMALHRLQISMPTSKIISFFHHIHSSMESTSAVRTRKATYMPTKEVINYKEFVAFVTAAYDQQQQRLKRKMRISKPRMSSKTRESAQVRRENLRPLSLPSTSLPIFARPNTLQSNEPVCAAATFPTEQVIHQYEMNDANSENGESAYETRVLKDIPDVLVSRILAEQAGTYTVSAKTREATTAIVRKSLESLVGKESVDERFVNEIARELIRERMKTSGDGSEKEADDVTGLKEAAAYFEQQAVSEDASDIFAADECKEESVGNWIEVLTEEQVSAVVQQLWKEMQARLPPAPVDQAGLADIDATLEQANQKDGMLKDEATDTSEVPQDTEVVAPEDEVQATANKKEVPSNDDVLQPVEEKNRDMPSRNPAPRTHLGRALEVPFDGSPAENDAAQSFTPVSTLQILQRLRQQRREHQIAAIGQFAQPVLENTVHPSKSWNASASISSNKEQQSDIGLSPREEQLSSMKMEWRRGSPPERIADSVECESAGAEASCSPPKPTRESLSLVEKMLDIDDSASKLSSSENQCSRREFSTSDSDFGSVSDYHERALGGEIRRQHTRLAATRRRQHRRRPLWTAVSRSGSSVPDSICSAELSEGELSREDAQELSDGEIYGKHKKKYIQHKNAAASTMQKETSSGDDTRSSVESGELVSLKATHSSYRRHLLDASSSSSVESGELEDGMLSPA